MTEEAEAFVRSLYPGVHGLLQLQTGSRDLADELTQEALARVWERWSRVSAMASPRGYAYRIALNLARSWYRRQGRERRALARLGRLGPEAIVAEPATAEHVATRLAVRGLPRRQREVVLLRFYAGLSVDETATALRCAPGTVKAHTHRALAHLRAELNEAHEHDGARRHRPATPRSGRDDPTT
jgi:RNA polymerase sigma factor (sigma-70 family)